jgi:hypothetical protein
MRKSSQCRSKKIESAAGFLLLSVMVFIAVAIIIKQNRYDHNVFNPDILETEAGGVSQTNIQQSNISNVLPSGFSVMAPEETYGPENLYEKINGKADLYLESGFMKLTCLRFVSHIDDAAWAELFLFDMGTAKNAFAVFSVQQRAEVEQLNWSRFAYKTVDAVFLARGKYYCEVTGALASARLLEVMEDVLKNFIRRENMAEQGFEELSLFPLDGLVENSFGLKTTNVFGFSEMKNAFTARYEIAGETLTAFLCRQPNAQAAVELAGSYYSFLIDNGAQAKIRDTNVKNAKTLDFYGSVEMIFTCGAYVAGIHEAESETIAAEVSALLYQKLNAEINP